MNKRLLSISVVLFFALTGLCAAYSGGDGSAETPYRISTPQDLNDIGYNPGDWDANFILTGDIDLSGYSGTEFSIIGSHPDNPFTGVFDGNSHTVSNFDYEVSGVSYIGLFSYVDAGAVIKNLTLQDPSVTAATSDYVGALAGYVNDASLIRCNVLSGSITADDWAGPLAGKTDSGAVVSFCGSNTPVNGGDSVGGLIGENRGTVSKCFATGDVDGSNYVGGLIGNDYMIISDCFSAGSAAGDNRVGGLIGRQNTFQAGEKTENCYSSASVTCSGSYKGGFVGYEQSSTSLFIGCFYNNQVNPGLDGIGNDFDPNVVGISGLAMRDEDTFTNAGWDFAAESVNGTDDTWQIQQHQSYPCLNLFTVGDLNADGIVNFYDLDAFADHWLEKNQ